MRRAPPESTPLATTSLFLDLDGTIAPLCEAPGDVIPEGRRTALLRDASERLAGRVAIVSGRTLASIDAITEGACAAAAGVHGLQRRTAAGDIEGVAPNPRVERAAERMAAFALGDPGLLVEYKEQSAALHYRGAPNAEAAVMEFVRRLAESEALQIQAGHMVMELRMPGPDKGAAVRAFMAEAPFRGTRPVYVGDDLTDESAFAEVASQGGIGVLVGRDRPTAATARLATVGDVLDWLSQGLAHGAFRFEERLRWAA
jgi:trehalose 6-phosphate phosphatase